jgi:predicted nuclease with TOPRIM domain
MKAQIEDLRKENIELTFHLDKEYMENADFKKKVRELQKKLNLAENF